MKYYKLLTQMPAFNLKDAESIIDTTGASQILNRMIKDKSLIRIKQNLYTCVNLVNGLDCADRFQIGSKITDDSFIAYHTAFEFYACYNQVYTEVHVCSSKRFKPFIYDCLEYKSFQTNSFIQIDTIRNTRVTSIERTIVDSINMIGKVMDAEELVKCLDLIIKIDEDKILEMLRIYDKEILYRKVGYVLSSYKEDFNLSNEFFEICKHFGKINNKGYFVKDFDMSYNSEWGLYTYKDIRKLCYKGGELDI